MRRKIRGKETGGRGGEAAAAAAAKTQPAFHIQVKKLNLELKKLPKITQ